MARRKTRVNAFIAQSGLPAAQPRASTSRERCVRHALFCGV